MNSTTTYKNVAEIKSALKQVKALLKDSVKPSDKEISAAITSTISNGKMVRPAFLLLFNLVYSQKINDDALKLATALEIFHNATLIHDDVIDASNLRRNKATLNAQYTEDVAIYAGDYLFASMYELVSQIEDHKYNNLFTKSMFEILNGELEQKRRRFNYDMTFDEYYSQIKGKTATLFSLAAGVGAMSAGQEDVELASQIGLEVGLAFQIVDDYLDYLQDDKKLNKPINQDLRRGIYTAPLLLAMEEDPPIVDLLKDGNYNQAVSAVQNSNAIDKTRAIIKKHTKNAQELITGLPKNKYQESLSLLFDELVTRKF